MATDKFCDSAHHEEETLLASNKRSEGTSSLFPFCFPPNRCMSQSLKHVLFLLATSLNLIFFIANIWWFSAQTKSASAQGPSFYSPAQEVVAFENRPVDGHVEDSIYAGYPNAESDAAWNALMEGTNLKIYPEEQSRLNQTSLQMNDKSGYLAALGVYHELHCIKRLRKWFYRDYYYPNSTQLEYMERMTHAEHCIEFIRQTAICHGDITVTSFKWLHDANGKVIEPTTKEGAMHRCVQWDKLSSWAKSRSVDLFDSSLLEPEAP
ncbi:hypothetical protein GGR57DRAFT_503118 [Xylariaceae sp. FL1272]|nr:hypothetical protein GGR57DRAFT_503118 [Xylariaceae sp. FL1272]